MKKNFLRELFSLPYKEFFYFSLIINVLVAGFVLALKNNLPPIVPLMYGLPVGEEQLVPRIFLAGPSVISIILIIINILIAKLVGGSFVQKVLVGLTMAVTLLAAVTTLKIFFLIASF